MSEEIKFDPLFGPQELFFDGMDDVVCVSKNNETGEKFHYTSIDIALRDLDRYEGDSDFTVAMRRIIKTPVWTKEDHQAGKLPEVGAAISARVVMMVDEDGDCIYEIVTAYFLGVDNVDSELWHVRLLNGRIIDARIDDCNPIEKPEERAKREEDEVVKLLLSENVPDSSFEWRCLFERGVRAAYRKFKMSEVQK